MLNYPALRHGHFTSLSADNFRKRLKTHLFRNAFGHSSDFAVHILVVHILYCHINGHLSLFPANMFLSLVAYDL